MPTSAPDLVVLRQVVTVVGRAIHRGASVGTAAGAAITGALAGYLAVVTAAGTRRPRPDLAVADHEPRTRFVVMIPAHNEEQVIGRALDSLRDIEYPSELFDVHVVADNCTDGTVRIVEQYGFRAHDRLAPDEPGKGPALNWLFDRLEAEGEPFDAVVILDADTSVDSQLLRAFERSIRSGAHAVQAFYGVRDDDGSAMAGVRAAALACRHHLRPLGRNRLGASCGLYGNGMAFRRTLMAPRRWSGHLTEDMEFQMELLLDGHCVAYAPDARVAAEMPTELAAAATQNARWEAGRLQLARTYIPILWRRLVRGQGSRRAIADALFDHAVPPLSVLLLADVAVTGSGLGLWAIRRRRVDAWSATVGALATATLVVHLLCGLRSVDAPASTYRALRSAPRAVLWKVRLWATTLRRPGDVTWQRTARNQETRT